MSRVESSVQHECRSEGSSRLLYKTGGQLLSFFNLRPNSAARGSVSSVFPFQKRRESQHKTHISNAFLWANKLNYIYTQIYRRWARRVDADPEQQTASDLSRFLNYFRRRKPSETSEGRDKQRQRPVRKRLVEKTQKRNSPVWFIFKIMRKNTQHLRKLSRVESTRG